MTVQWCRGRWVVVARIAGLLVVAAVALTAAPARADVTGVIPADQDGPNDFFHTNQNLFATGVSNTLQGGAELCVVKAHISSGTCGEVDGWDKPNVIAFQGTFPPTPIAAAPLAPGTWRILADNGDDTDDVVSDQFTVEQCPAEDDCSSTLAQAQMQSWKDAAAASATGMGAFCLASSVWKAGGAEFAGSALISDGLRGAIVAEIKEATEVTFTPLGTQNGALALLRAVSCGAWVMYKDIVADPPDPDYKHLAEPDSDDPAFAVGGDGNVVAAATALEELRDQGVAHRIGIERYQGALAAGDDGWAAVHLGRVGDQALDTQTQMRQLPAKLDAAAVAIGSEAEAATAQQVDVAEAIRTRIRTTGFTSGELAELQAQNLSEDEIADVRAQLGAQLPEGIAPTAPAAAALAAADALASANCVDDADLCGFDQMGRHAGAAGLNGAVPPTLTIGALQLREGDVGVNHGRVKLELSHPTKDTIGGSITVTPESTAEDEVEVTNTGLYIPPWTTTTYVSVATRNDTLDEPAETAQLVANPNIAEIPTTPAAVTVLDDDGAGDPQTPPRARRGVILMQAPTGIHVSEPDGTELAMVFDDPLSQRWLPAWTPNGKWLIVQDQAPTASALAINGEPVYRWRMNAAAEPQGSPEPIVAGKPYPAYPTFSADGTRLLMSQFRDGSYKLAVFPFDQVTGAIGAVHVTGDDPPLEGWWSGHGASFNPDRTRIAFAGCGPGFDPCGIFTVPVDAAGAATGPPVQLRDAPPNELYFPSWSPDGTFIAYTQTVQGASGTRTQRVGAAGQPIGAPKLVLANEFYMTIGLPAWAPDSRALAIGQPSDPTVPIGTGGRVVVVDVDAEGAPVGQPRTITPVGWSPVPLWGTLPDVAAPVTTATVSPDAGGDGIHRTAVTVALKAVDDRAVTRLDYSVDGVATQVSGDSASIPLTTDGTYTIRFRARDAAGNVEIERERVVKVEIPAPPVQTATPTPDPPVVVPTAVPTVAPTATAAPPVAPAALPSNRRCVSRRKFTIRLREAKDDPLVRAEVFVGAKRAKVVTGARLRAAVDLRGLPKGKVTVRVVGTTRSGRRTVSSRTYRTCVPKKRS